MILLLHCLPVGRYPSTITPPVHDVLYQSTTMLNAVSNKSSSPASNNTVMPKGTYIHSPPKSQYHNKLPAPSTGDNPQAIALSFHIIFVSPNFTGPQCCPHVPTSTLFPTSKPASQTKTFTFRGWFKQKLVA